MKQKYFTKKNYKEVILIGFSLHQSIVPDPCSLNNGHE
jgi:hypothetical protein